MELKQKWRRFWTLNRHHEDGFTLIELVVTIAILAILAGAGTGVYSGYIQASNKGNDKVLVGNVMRALETAAYSYTADFAVEGQYSTGLQIPVGHVVLTTEGIEAVSNDTENNPIDKALVAAMGADYSTAYKLSYDKWETGAIGGNLHNATSDMMQTLKKNANILITVEKTVGKYADLGLVSGDYKDSGELILGVSTNIAAMGEENFLNAWMGASSVAHNQAGFGLSNREDYTAVRTAYNNSFAEYVRANYSGDKDADTLADGIANYGESAGDLVNDKLSGKWYAGFVSAGVNAVIGDTKFAHTVNTDAFTNDTSFIGYDDEELLGLYNEWLETSAANDAATFYNTMVTASTDGKKYAEENGTDKLADWVSSEAQRYSDSMSAVQSMVTGESAIVVTAYYQNGLMAFDVYSAEADPRND